MENSRERQYYEIGLREGDFTRIMDIVIKATKGKHICDKNELYMRITDKGTYRYIMRIKLFEEEMERIEYELHKLYGCYTTKANVPEE